MNIDAITQLIEEQPGELAREILPILIPVLADHMTAVVEEHPELLDIFKQQLAKFWSATCPFCGSVKRTVAETGPDHWATICSDCAAQGPRGKTEKEGQGRWLERRGKNDAE